jgi:hypothetical protein
MADLLAPSASAIEMEQTDSYLRVFPKSILDRYEFAEVRNAASVIAGTNPVECGDMLDVLDNFWLTLASLTDPGKNKGVIASTLDTAFRKKGWREAGHHSETAFTLEIEPYVAAGEKGAQVRVYKYSTRGHKVDNVRGRIALDVEWNAKDGNLDRDLANFRALHEVGVIDAAVILTRHHERTKYAANYLAEKGNVIRYNAKGKRIILLGTSTTTNLEKLVPRLKVGNGGGCPVLAVAFTELCYRAGKNEPALPAFKAPIVVPGVPDTDAIEDEG